LRSDGADGLLPVQPETTMLRVVSGSDPPARA